MNLSTAFHLEMDGQVERNIHTLKDMLRARVIALQVVGSIFFLSSTKLTIIDNTIVLG